LASDVAVKDKVALRIGPLVYNIEKVDQDTAFPDEKIWQH
jgi:hypothetical protein